MQAQAFLASVRDAALTGLPDELSGLHSRIRYGMLQLHYGDPRIHYEVWLVRKTGQVEVGLHFEADRELNLTHAEALAPRVHELREALGPDAELEQWSPSWTRLHLTVEIRTLDAPFADEVAAKLTSLIRLTGEEISQLPARVRTRSMDARPETRKHWHRRGRSAARPG
jgi:hypothetical protein